MMVGEKKQKRIDQIDGRTVLFLTLCACIVTFLTTSFLGHGCFSFLIFLILCWFGLYKQALGCFAVYLVAIVWLMIETKYQISIPSPLLLSMIYKLLLPAMPAYLLAKIPSGKLTASLRKMPIPTRIMLVLIVMLRFAPTVLHEFGEVREAMKIRGFLKIGWQCFETPNGHIGICHCPDGISLLKDRGRVSRFCHSQGN